MGDASPFYLNMKESGDLVQALDSMEHDLRNVELVKALKEAGKVVQRKAKANVSEPGYPGDKPGLKPLRETIIVVIRQYGSKRFAYVGPKWPEGNHGFNVEHGHRVVYVDRKTGKKVEKGTAAPHPFLAPAFEDSRSEIVSIITKSLQDAAAKARTV